MHASIEQLLTLCEGGPVDAASREHVTHCAECAAALAELEDLRRHLHAIPVCPPPEDGWERVLAHRRARRNRLAGVWAAAAVLVLAVGVTWNLTGIAPPRTAALSGQQTTDAGSATLTDLVAQSQSLERLLRALPTQGHVIRASVADRQSLLEDRIALLDYQINRADTDGARPALQRELWQTRVDLMQSLVALRYSAMQSREL